MLKATFRIRLPEHLWINDISRSFPDVTFRLFASDPTETGTVGLGSFTADDPESIIEAAREHPSIAFVDVLERTDETAVVKHESTQAELEGRRALSIPIEFPVVVRNGWYEVDLTGTQDELDRLRSKIEQAGLEYELLSLVERSEDGSGLLTERQREILEEAIRQGYYEIPRECRLADLAATVGADKATVSEVLRRGEGALVKWFLTGNGANRQLGR